MLRRGLACVALVLALAACGGGGGGGAGADGAASLWVTRDRGEVVMLTATVPAGLSALEALRREAEVETRYGGRFVQAVNGVEGSSSARRDWFWFVNGIEGDRGAAEYELRAGDVLWWDFRSWRGRMEEPVVVGAFPEPFLHGYDGRVRPAAVRYDQPDVEQAALQLGELVAASSVADTTVSVEPEANLLVVALGSTGSFRARPRRDGYAAGDPVRFDLVADLELLRRLARDPSLVRFRYEGLP